jgi:hypothetical protein
LSRDPSHPVSFHASRASKRYPADWDKSVDSREGLFREDLIGVFSRFNRIVFFTDNIAINSSVGKTDIDVLAFDPGTRILGIFQLKWQEPFTASMRERECKKKNFLHTGNAWVEKVCAWIGDGKMPETLTSLGMPKNIADRIKETRVFVLGRTTLAHSSGEFRIDPRAAWGSWSQVQRLLDSNVTRNSPLTELHEMMKQDAPQARARRIDRVTELKIPGLTISIYSPPAAGS